MKKRIYLALQLKRAAKKYPVIIAVTLITLITMAVLAFWSLSTLRSGEDFQKVRIGIVGDIHDTYLGVGVYALKNIDSSRFSVDFAEMEKADAEKALKNNEINGYIEIPDGFIKNVLRGKNTPATYYMRKGGATFGSVITGEITGTVSEIVTQTQTAIYSMQDAARAHGKSAGLSKKNDVLNLKYIDFVLNRSKIFDTQITGFADSLSVGGYYAGAVIIFFMMLWGISCSSLFASKNLALARLMTSRGIGAVWQVMCEYASFFILTFATVLILVIGALSAAGGGGFGIRELSGMSIADRVMLVIKLTPVIMMVTAMQLAIYEAVPNIVGAVLLQFMTAIGLGYLSGCFYPNYFFPEGVQRMALYLPAGAGFSYIRKLLGSGEIMGDMLICFLYSGGFTTLTAALRKIRTAGDGR